MRLYLAAETWASEHRMDRGARGLPWLESACGMIPVGRNLEPLKTLLAVSSVSVKVWLSTLGELGLSLSLASTRAIRNGNSALMRPPFPDGLVIAMLLLARALEARMAREGTEVHD